jgi:hypothetical protein
MPSANVKRSARDPDVLLTIVRYLTKATTAACRSSRSRKILAIAPATQSARPLLRNTSRQDASGEYTGRTSQPSGRSMCQLFTTWEGEGGAAFGSEV